MREPIILKLEDGSYTTYPTLKYKNRNKYQSIDCKTIKSCIPGTVSSISVQKGQLIKKGDDVLSIEAMKMHNKIKAPQNGKVAEIRVKEGDKVTKETILVRMM